MKIKTLHTNDEREVEDLKVVSYDEYDSQGNMTTNKYVEFMIKSARSWKDFMPVKDFKRLNPTVKVAGLN